MAYTIKPANEFMQDVNNYLKKHPLNLSNEEILINNFSSTNLSDLYKLFLDLENYQLSINSFNKLKYIINANFSFGAGSIFDGNVSCITSEHIDKLANIIKEEYSKHLSDNTNSINKKEFYKMSVIINKTFPKYFLGLITNPKGDIKSQQAFIKDKILSTIEHWHMHNSKESEEEIRDIASAFYITAKRLYPELNIYIPGRTKSTKSSVYNLSKEITKSLSSLIPSNKEEGISDKDLQEQFDLQNANTDFSALTIVLDHTDDTIHFDKLDPKSVELLNLRRIKEDNIDFLHYLEALIEKDVSFSNKDLLQIKIDLLIRLRESSYDECTEEFHGTSFAELLKRCIEQYNGNSNQSMGDVQLEEIYELLDELKKRVQDKFHAKLLETYIPEIFKDELFTKTLRVKHSFIKEVKKKNGFCALYYCLETIDGKMIELQAQTKKRFEVNKENHSDLPNKEIDISRFFEPVDPNCDQEQFKSFINLLSNTPIATQNFLNKFADYDLSPADKRLKRKLRIAEQNVKLKENYENIHISQDGTKHISKFTLEDYLPIFAEYVSPKLMSISSHHTRFHKSIAAYNKKSILSAFTDVLLKHDSTTCLAQMLIDKLEEIISSPKNEVSLNGINKRAQERYNSYNSSNDAR